MSKKLDIIHRRNILLLKIIAICFVIDLLINLVIDRSILLVIVPTTLMIILPISLLIYYKVWIKETAYIIVLTIYLPFIFLIEREPLIINYIFIWAALTVSSIYQRAMPVIVSSCIANFLTIYYYFKFKNVIFVSLEPTSVVYIIAFTVFLTIILIFSGRFTENELWSKEEALKRSEMLSAVGQLAAGVAHEIKNPVTVLSGFVQLMRQSDERESHQFYYEIMQSELKRILMITNEFLVLGKQHTYIFMKKKIQLIIKEVVLLLKAEAEKNGVNIILKIKDDIPAMICNPDQLKQVFMNVIKNGIEAMPNGGRLWIDIKVDGNKSVIIETIDEGCGMTKETLTKIGTPFFTTKEDGTGLGMMVCQKIIESHHGKITMESEVNVGTKIKIEVPIK
ncbi:signal transduction histidine kinase [Schinkia azotoformans MEV2011]|uniref:histidine kinase n=1 Tax=Schinkia azotoformans MEV2011 TaxID=1348973 RepID=A0A072NHJ7_SCHAZ|nr:ATP-binding protein [Schinkia azotoformans]KEF36717.1 signal transduction histidine kinase [Schinkia azotoformans MEV2011]MEC1695423.1 ATP-binding protein [Schinkia azotoformans]MEC1715102.1 ATP-binding protein [Schinkia azotoformans]MEC1724389.1 ATP-binding protein [Schinkia azotoformans]MEC1742641.1 ATP-binding protein [Schinkia azotoformans]